MEQKHKVHSISMINNTFYSQRIGKCKTIYKGTASAAIIINSVILRFKVFVA
jgi:hypothetical protein